VPLETKDVSVKQRLRLAALVLVGGRFAALARERGWSQLHVLSAGDAAYVAAFASHLTGIDYSLTLLASLEGYGPTSEKSGAAPPSLWSCRASCWPRWRSSSGTLHRRKF
jgi:hypothetical protein